MKKLCIYVFSILTGFPIIAQTEYDPIFQDFPNSGISFEGLYANPISGSACIGDFNEDGYPDIIVMGPNYDDFATSYVNLIKNNGDGTFKRVDLGITGMNNGSINYLKTGSKQYLIALQGGTATPASTANAKAVIAELRYNTSTNTTFTVKQQLDYGLINGDLLFLDIDGDGHEDLIQMGGNNNVYTYLNDGNNNFILSSDVTGLSGTYRGKAIAYDVNKDGKTDIVYISQNGGLKVSINNGDKTFTTLQIESEYNFKSYPRIELGDFNKDGNIDIVAFDHISSSNECSVVFFYGDGKGEFAQAPANNFMGVEAAAVGVGDFDGDGNLDVLYAGHNRKALKTDENGTQTKKAYILLGDGKGNFTQHVKSTPVNHSPDIFCLAPVNGQYYIADFDRDGKPDIFALGELAELKGGKLMRCADLFLSSLTYGFGEPVEKTLIEQVWQGFPYSQVRLEEGRLKEAMDKEIRYLKTLDVNRLLAQTLRYNLGINDYQTYGSLEREGGESNWEYSGNGASFSHYLSAISMAYAATGDEELLERVNYIVDIITRSQEVMGDGLFAFNDAPVWGFYKMAKEKMITPYGHDENGHPWGNNNIGFPWYAHHKLFACLRDAYLYAGNEKARITFIKFCEWAEMWMQCFDHTNFQKLLESEHGGMVESFADAYALSGKEKFLHAAVKFTRDNFADKMCKYEDDLSGRHTNFHAPMALGSAVHYLHTDDIRSQYTAKFFFDIVHEYHTLCNGGNGNNERFGTPDLLTYRLGQRGPETCTSYNMLKLAKELFCQEGSVHYMDYYENTMWNHILAILSTREDAGVCYHVNLKPGTFKTYDNLYGNFWCCVGTGMESHVKYVDAIYFKGEDDLLINLFASSSLDWEEKGLGITMETIFPATEEIKIKIDKNTSFNGDIFVRYPSWAEQGSMSITVNGAEQSISAKPGDLAALSHNWSTGDEIIINIACTYRLVDLPDDINVSAIFYGPVLLSADLGPIGDNEDVGYQAPPKEIRNPAPDPYFPSLVASRSDLSSWIEKEAGELKFKTKGLETNYEFIPFYDMHHRRYTVYWKVGDGIDLQKERELIPDRIITGVNDDELAHSVVFKDSNTGYGSFAFWGPTYYRFRDASMSGHIQYTLELLSEELPEDKQYYLQITYFGDESGGYGNFWIEVDGTRIKYVESIDRLARLDFAQRYYPIPRELTDGKNMINVKFSGGRLSLYGIKLTTVEDLIYTKRVMEGRRTEKPGLPVIPAPNNIEENRVDGNQNSEMWVEKNVLYVTNRQGAIIQLVNLNGQVIKTIDVISNNESIDLYPQQKGIYIVKCISSKRVEGKKIVLE